ncbi:MAG: DUF348 domain-containing protein [Clostridia bacterium]|nr:DUF348 domain-containing protein [Clostridia bacterium]
MLDRLSRRTRILFQQRVRVAAVLMAGVLAVFTITGFSTTKTTYLITDGDTVTTVEGYTTEQNAALNRAGIRLSPTDLVSSSRIGNTTNLFVTRSMTVTVNADGASNVALAYNGTVEGLLNDLSLTLGEEDAVSQNPTTPLTDGMTVDIQRRSVSVDTQAAPIPYNSLRQENPQLYRGEERIAQAGAYGLLLSSVRTVTDEAGSVLRADALNSQVYREPTDEIVEYGTKIKTVPNSWLNATGDVLTNITGDESIGGVLTTASGEQLPYTNAITCVATAYTTERQSWKITATGTTARVGAIAVDPKVIPYGTKMYIVTSDGAITYGVATAEDCGGAIKGKKLDLFYDTYNECIQFGVRKCTVYFLA